MNSAIENSESYGAFPVKEDFSNDVPIERVEKLPADLNPEIVDRIKSAKAAMIERFDLTGDQVQVIPYTHQDGQQVALIVLGGRSGRYFGSYNDIMRPKLDSRYVIDYGGEKFDTRSLTWEAYKVFINKQRFEQNPANLDWGAYKALLAKQQAEGIDPLPDSFEPDNPDPEHWTETLLLGEPPDGVKIYTGEFNGHGPLLKEAFRHNYSERYRMRPAVEIQLT